MASAAAQLFVQVTANVRGLVDGFDAARQAATKLGDGVDKAAGVYVDASGRMRDASGKFVAASNGIGGAITSLGTIAKGTALGELLADGIRSAAGAMLDFGRQSLQLASDLEQTRISFTTMTGSAAKADSLLRDLASFAANTPFELTGLVDSSKKLMAFGFDAKAILPVMNAVGNAVAAVGGGKDTLDGVTRALGQMAAKGKVSAEEMQQLAERGIPAWRMLAEGIGVSTPEAMKRAEKGAIDANTAIVAILNGMNKRFPDMMAKQSQTFAGAMSNLQDVTKQTMARIGQSLIDAFNLTAVIRNVTTAIQNLTNAFYAGGLIDALNVAFGPSAKAMVIALGVTITGAMIPALVSAAAALVPIAAGFVAAAAASAPLIAAGLAVGAAAYVIMRQWDNLAGLYLNVVADMAQATTWFRNSAAKIWNDIGGFVGRKLMEINAYIREVFGVDLAAKMGVGVGKIGQGFSEISMWASEKMGIVRDAFSYAADDIAANFTYAFNQGAVASKMAFGKITADTLGLPKVTQAATTAAAKHHKTAAQIAREHAAEAKRVEAQYMRNLQTYLAQEAVTYKLRDGLKKLEADQARLGLAFDAAGAKAELYRSVLSQIEQAFGKASRQAMSTRTAIAELQAASDNGGAALAKAYEIIGKAGAGLDLAQRQAEALGQAFDRNAEGVKLYEQAIKDLVEMGLKPGNEAYDKAIKSLDAYRAAQIKAPASLKDMAEAQRDVIGGLKDLVTGAFDVADMLGLQVPSSIKVGALALFAGAATVGVMIMAVNSLTAAWATFTTAFATNPIGAALVVAGAAVVGIVAAVQAVRSEQQKAADEAAKAAEAVAAKAEEVKAKLVGSIESGLRSSAQAFMAGADSYQDKMRESFREGIINGVLDAMMQKAMLDGLGQLMKNVVNAAVSPMQAGLAEAMKAFADGAAGALAKLEPVLSGLRTQLDVYVPLAVKEADESAKRISRAASGGGMGVSASDLDRRNLEAMESYRNNLLKTVERLINAGAQNPASRLYNEYIQALDAANKATQDIGRMLNQKVEEPKPAATSNVIGLLAQDTFPNTTFIQPKDQYTRGVAPASQMATPALNATVNVNYTGTGKWTREDAQGLGRMMVSELRALGVRA